MSTRRTGTVRRPAKRGLVHDSSERFPLMRPPRTSRAWQIVLLLLACGMLVALTYGNIVFAERAPGGNDFLPRWLGTRQWVTQGINPYDPSVAQQAQQMIYGRPADPTAGEDLALFAYPLPITLFVVPFSLFPFVVARALWMTLLEVSLLVLMLLSIQLTKWRPGSLLLGVLMLFSITWYHGFRDVVLGQFSAVDAVLIAGGLLAIQRGSDAMAGILFAFSLCKPQLIVLLIPFVLLWALTRRRMALFGWIIGASVVLFGGFMVLSPSWPILWLRQVITYPTYTATVSASPISLLAGLFPAGSGWITAIVSSLFGFYLLWEWVLSSGKHDSWFQWTAAMTLVVTQLVSPRTASTNFLVFMPGIMLIFDVCLRRWHRAGTYAVAIIGLALAAAPWLLFLNTVQGNQESLLMLVPLPLLMFVGLWWVRWWATRAPVLGIGDAVPLGSL
jgi:hypothetical protein